MGAKWISEFKNALENLSSAHYLPDRFYLVRQPDFAELFSSAAIEASGTENSPDDSGRTVEIVGKETLKDSVAEGEGTDADAFLLMLAAYADSSFRKGDLEL